MKKSHIIRAALALLLAFAAAGTAGAESKDYIDIRTKNSQMLLGTGPKGELLFLHYGAPCGDPAQFDSYRSYRRKDYGTDPQAYPARGARFFNQAALAVRYADSDRNTELQYVSHSESTPGDGVCRHEVLLRDPKTQLEVTLIYTAYVDEDVIAANTVIRNGGRKPVSLDDYASSTINIYSEKYMLTHFYGSWAREMQVDREYLTHGNKIIDNRMGASTTHTENPSFILSLGDYSERDGEAIGGALAWTGNYRICFKVDETDRLNIISGINPEAAEYPLEKGAELSTPQMLWTYSLRGAGQVSRNFHDWARRFGSYDHGRLCPTLLNSWEGAYFDFNTKTLTDMIDDAASMGLEMFVLDDGWFGNKYPRNNDKQGLGDWEVNSAKLPEGLGYLADYAHSKGLKFGIWIEPEMVNPKSELAERHPEWVVKSPEREIPTKRNQWILDMSNPKVQDFVFGVFDRTMQAAPGTDYIKWDCNRIVESFGSEYLDDQGRFYVDYVKGLYSVLERIRAKYPDVYIQCCSSGGGRVDFGQMKYFDEFWTSDNTEGLSRIFIQYGTGLIYPAFAMGSHVSAVPNHQTGNITPLKFRFDIAASGRLGMELQPKNMSDEEKDFARRAIASYKEFRDLVAEGDLYRIASPYDKDHSALMYVSKDRKRAVFFAWCIRYQSRTPEVRFRLDGLDGDTKYRVRELNVEKSCWWGDGKSFSGDFLMNQGMNPQLRKIYDSAIFLIEAE